MKRKLVLLSIGLVLAFIAENLLDIPATQVLRFVGFLP